MIPFDKGYKRMIVPTKGADARKKIPNKKNLFSMSSLIFLNKKVLIFIDFINIFYISFPEYSENLTQ
ncbi:hypothetical protein EU94_0914 [Prochlorococcus marinus str. MIT 9123]|nr:hypothetical protein EU94_0914 [Prochlorococcus marinus str. MIT 9123]